MDGINLDYYIPGVQEYFNQEKLNENTEKTKASIEKLASSADDHETRLEAQEAQTAELESSKLFRTKLVRPEGWIDYRKAVIVLHKIGISSGAYSAPEAYCSGTFLFSRSALSYKVQAQVLTGSGYVQKYNQASMLVQGTVQGQNLKLVEFEYESNRYVGLEIYFTAAPVYDVFFSGEIGGRDIDANALKWVMYYNTKEKEEEILNEEIYNSIKEVDETQANFTNTVLEFNRKTIYHAGNSYPIVEKGSNANGEYIRFADGTQICYGEKEYTNVGITNAVGSAYYKISVISYPAKFVKYPSVSTSFSGTSFLTMSSDWANVSSNYFSGYILSPKSIESTSFKVQYTATGKWK